MLYLKAKPQHDFIIHIIIHWENAHGTCPHARLLGALGQNSALGFPWHPFPWCCIVYYQYNRTEMSVKPVKLWWAGNHKSIVADSWHLCIGLNLPHTTAIGGRGTPTIFLEVLDVPSIQADLVTLPTLWLQCLCFWRKYADWTVELLVQIIRKSYKNCR